MSALGFTGTTQDSCIAASVSLVSSWNDEGLCLVGEVQQYRARIRRRDVYLDGTLSISSDLLITSSLYLTSPQYDHSKRLVGRIQQHRS